MNTDEEIGTSKNKILKGIGYFVVLFIILVSLLFVYNFRNLNIYHSINVSVGKDASINYGANEFNIDDYIEGYEGESIEVLTDFDTSKLGDQEVIVEITKKGIKKDIPIRISVVDKVSPEIKINEDAITKNEGEEFDVNSNISDILDDVDGKLNYVSSEEIKDDSKNYYTYYSDSDLNSVGVHNITVKAVDASGNVSEKAFTYEVKEVYVPAPAPVNNEVQVNHNLPVNGASGGIVGLAYSLIGSRYVSGGNSPAGFDCSGFVQYVYAQNGISISRSSYSQAYDGYAVPYSEAQPGDILNWGYGPGSITHSALYVGGGQMIHATNPSQGVILSDVAGWTRGSGTSVISVRRII